MLNLLRKQWLCCLKYLLIKAIQITEHKKEDQKAVFNLKLSTHHEVLKFSFEEFNILNK